MKRAPVSAPVRSVAALLLLVVAVLSACGGGMLVPRDAEEKTSAGPSAEGRLPPDGRPLRYRLDLELDPIKSVYDGTVEIDVQLDRQRDVIWLHGRRMALHRPAVRLSDGTTLVGRARAVGAHGLVAVFL